VSPAVAAVVDRCLSKLPEARFESGDDLARVVGAGGVVGPVIPDSIARLREQIDQAAAIMTGALATSLASSLYASLEAGRAFLSELDWLMVAPILGFGTLVPTALVVASIRAVRNRGFSRHDLVAGIGTASHIAGRQRHLVASGVIAVGSTSALFLTLELASNASLNLAISLMLLALLMAIPAIATADFVRRLLSWPRIADWWSARLGGRLGRWLVAVADWRPFGRKAPSGHAPRDQPTEKLVGVAARMLFDGLTPDVRHRLADMPQLIERFETLAERLRRREIELAEALASVRPGDGREGDAALADHRRRAVADLEEAREAARSGLATAVAALESLRLDLLRLKAGVVRPDAITTDLAAVWKLSEEVDRLLMGTSN
jgi:hypothetical protein